MALISVGRPAPSFSLADQDGKVHKLSDYSGKPLVLYFYPKDDTTACTEEACSFQEQLPRFRKLSIPVLGISPDDEKSHRKFAAKFDLAFPLLADAPGPNGVPPVCDAYGVWAEKSMYGRKYMGVVRTTYLIGADGVVDARWDNVKVKGHVEAVLAAATGGHSGALASTIEPKPLRTSAGPQRKPAGAVTGGTPVKRGSLKKSALVKSASTQSAPKKSAPKKAVLKKAPSKPAGNAPAAPRGKGSLTSRSRRSASRH